MPTVLPNEHSVSHRMRVPDLLRRAMLVCAVTASTANAQRPPVHWLHAGAMPPGAIGSQRLTRGGPVSGYFQPVKIQAPQGAWISLAEEGNFGSPHSDEILVGMHIGGVYRLRVGGFGPDFDSEVYPTVEVIDRLYPPAGLALKYPIPVELTENELNLAADGAMITRVIYLEEPATALPVKQANEQAWIEAPRGADPLVVADEMGRPVAILRIGGRVPQRNNPTITVCDPPFIYFGQAS